MGSVKKLCVVTITKALNECLWDQTRSSSRWVHACSSTRRSTSKTCSKIATRGILVAHVRFFRPFPVFLHRQKCAYPQMDSSSHTTFCVRHTDPNATSESEQLHNHNHNINLALPANGTAQCSSCCNYYRYDRKDWTTVETLASDCCAKEKGVDFFSFLWSLFPCYIFPLSSAFLHRYRNMFFSWFPGYSHFTFLPKCYSLPLVYMISTWAPSSVLASWLLTNYWVSSSVAVRPLNIISFFVLFWVFHFTPFSQSFPYLRVISGLYSNNGLLLCICFFFNFSAFRCGCTQNIGKSTQNAGW